MEKLIYETTLQQDTDEYIFRTIAGITYACYFFSVADIFAKYSDVASLMYGFNLDVANGDVQQQGADEKISNIVVFVVEQFLSQNTAAVIYLCDTTDNRRTVRKRKFDSWFKRFDKGNVIKLDREVLISGSLIYNTLLISKSNLLAEQIVSVFISLNDNLKDKATEQ